MRRCATRLSKPVHRAKPLLWGSGRLWRVGLFLLLLFVVAQLSGLREHLSLAYVHAQFRSHRVQGVLLFTLLFCVGNLVQIPGIVFLAAAVLALGKLEGALLTYGAALVACTLSFALVRGLGGDALRQVRSAWLLRMLQYLDARPLRLVILLRTLMQTAPALNCALALSGLAWRPYLLGTLLGLPLPIALYSWFFDSVARYAHLPLP